mmetsp:Transcript_25590/g.38219  ORF Transcript_25590/g.38219 Transcript_25590/m.38219 type:complete len:213 (-) Transcript_25590:126-764(-)
MSRLIIIGGGGSVVRRSYRNTGRYGLERDTVPLLLGGSSSRSISGCRNSLGSSSSINNHMFRLDRRSGGGGKSLGNHDISSTTMLTLHLFTYLGCPFSNGLASLRKRTLVANIVPHARLRILFEKPAGRVLQTHGLNDTLYQKRLVSSTGFDVAPLVHSDDGSVFFISDMILRSASSAAEHIIRKRLRHVRKCWLGALLTTPDDILYVDHHG